MRCIWDESTTPLQGTSFKHGWMERYACMELFSNTTICATLQRIFVDSEKNAINAR